MKRGHKSGCINKKTNVSGHFMGSSFLAESGRVVCDNGKPPAYISLLYEKKLQDEI